MIKMDYEKTIKDNANRIRSIGEEIIEENKLEDLLKNKQIIKAYDGFEPSGRVHIAQGLMRVINVNELTKSGVKFVFWVADWFALLNLKMDGKKERIKKAGELMIHIWKACGMDIENVEFIWASDEIEKRSAEYWSIVFDIATKVNIKRTLRCTQIMGRKDFKDDEQQDNSLDEILTSMKTSQVFYPIMQCADIFFLNIDICSLGIDQRKVNMLAIEYCNLTKRKFKPVIISHHMIMGLDGSDKMSKSNPDSAIFMDDSEEDVNRKIKLAFCEPCNIIKNPILEYFKYIVFKKESDGVIVNILNFDTKEINKKKYETYHELENDFKDGLVYPKDLKESIKCYLNNYLNSVREYFKNNPEADKLRSEVKNFTKK